MEPFRNIKGVHRALALIAILVFAMSAQAQPDRAEALLVEAKSLASATDKATLEKSFAKFIEAAGLFRAAGNNAKADEAVLEHGRALRQAAVREMNASRHSEALAYFDSALEKVRSVNNRLEMAFVYHDLGYLNGELNKNEAAASFYQLALDNYRIVGDKDGEGLVLRNLGLLKQFAGDLDKALGYYEAALANRVASGQALQQAVLRIDLAEIYMQKRRYDEGIASVNLALPIYVNAKDRVGEASALFKLGQLQTMLYKYADAVRSFESALKIYESTGDTAPEGAAVLAIGRVLMYDSKHKLAEPFLLRATNHFLIHKNAYAEAYAALDLANNYQEMSMLPDAQAAFDRALAKFRETKDEIGEADALLGEGYLLSYQNKHDEALKRLEAARKIFLKNNDTSNDHRVARSFASYWYTVGNHAESIRYSTVALEIAERENDILAKALDYGDMANAYSVLGQRLKSIELTNKALAIARQVGNRNSEGIYLNNLGYENFLLMNYTEAESYLKQAIAILSAGGWSRPEGYATHNLGMVYYARREYAKALASYDRADGIYEKVADRRPQAFLLQSYGELYRDQGQYEKAFDYLQRAVVLAREIRYSQIEAKALGDMMTLWSRRNQPRLAVLYGKQAVNVYQSLRDVNRNADKSSLKSFVQSNEKTYRQLANILIEEGRLAEAQQVLDLLKAEEYFEFVRRDATEAGDKAALALTESERKALEEYSRVSANLTALGATFQKLQDQRNRAGGKLPEAEEAEYLRLKTQVETAGEGMKTFFTKLASEFSKKVEDGTVVTPQSIETLKADLRRAGTDVVLVSTYLLPERYRAIVTTGRTMVDRKVEYSAIKLTGADINRKIFEFQRALQNPKVDPRKLGKELYDIFVKPLEEDLRGAGAKTILWSLDGSLRYIPMAALSPDGKTYLADKYQNVVVTLGRQTNLFAKPSTEEWRAIGAGVSKQHTGFSPLPSVPAEIGSIVRDEKHTGGVLNGTRMLDEQFNLQTLRDTVPQQTEDGKAFNVLHLATHFSLGANDQDSALLLGDGKRLSLFEIGRDEALDFKDVELLTLSACQTGVSTGDANGREVESLGMLAQKKGAKAVLATLWKVADESTSLFMAEFYSVKKANPTMNKAEAIRLAQKAMIDGRIKSSGKSNTCRADEFTTGPKQNEFKCDPTAPYSHPYFWSPFVLIGNWR